MKFIQLISQKIKVYLSSRISPPHLRLSAFLISLLSCLVSGSILLFTLFAPTFHSLLGLTYLQINFIASVSIGGMYLSLPILGYLSDCYGPSILLFLSMWLFVPAYFCNSLLVSKQYAGVWIYAITFGMIGLATSSLYFSNLLTCAKIFPHHKGLAISLPVTCYGLSALLGSQVLKMEQFKYINKAENEGRIGWVQGNDKDHDDSNNVLNLVRAFKFFALLYLIVGILSFVSSSIVIVEQDAIFEEFEDMITGDTTNATSSASASASASSSGNINTDSFDLGASETTPLRHDPAHSYNELTPLRSRRSMDPPNHKQRYLRFLKDISAWVILISLILNIGPLESYQNNLSSIIALTTAQSMPSSAKSLDLSNKVGLLATFSTLSRLILGVLIDLFQSHKLNPIWLLVCTIVVGSFGQWYNNIILSGIAYGGLFTIYPTIVASVWGIDIMGSTWGSLMIAPAIGSIIYSLFYGKIADQDLANPENGIGAYFVSTSISLVVSCVLVLMAYKVWRKRGQLLS